MRILLFCLIALISISSFSQSHYWQQEASYKMDIDFNVEKHQFSGIQELEYTNNSADTLHRVFYHLYFNAFQKGSMMDVRSRNIEDPDRRVGDRIFSLTKEEEGYQKINSLTQDGAALTYIIEGTILEVKLAKPILPNSKTVLKMNFEAQVPKQVRRSGRDNAEGIAYSMTQWYPKMAEYDLEGWHANPYIGREFHGVWGTFDIKIKMDSAYTIAGTGYLQNKEEVGKGYAARGSNTSAKLEWHFKSPKVHDFAWAADKNYKHMTHQVEGGPLLRFFYVPTEKTVLWDSLPKYTALIFQKMNEKFGVYPYDEYAVIQGGDGGMEYAMATLITGHRSKGSLIGVTAHEAIHSWYQHVLATNESFYSWMDEGFTSYAEDVVLSEILPDFKPFNGSYRSYYSLVTSGKQMPLTTHADWYHTNRAYGAASYSMGCIFLHQLSYIIGQNALNKGMLNYYNQWKFKHPTPTDFKRIMEKVSGMELDWYFDQWLKSTNTIDYAIQSTSSEKKKTVITLERKGEMPMPIDITVKLKNGKELQYYIPLTIMRAEKQENTSAVLLKDWPWTYPAYEFSIDVAQFEIESIEIDPTKRMADVDQTNNIFPRSKESTYKGN